MTDIGFLTPFVDMSKKDISTIANNAIDNALENGNDALHLIAIGVKMETLGKAIKDKGSKSIECIEELNKENGKKRTTANVELSIREVGTKYDYSATEFIAEIDSQIDELEGQKKEVQEIAKIIKTRTEWTHPQTGEQIIIMPAGKSSTTSIVTKVL